jgi:PAS domain-containing protein
MQIPKVAFYEPGVDFHEVFKVSAMATALLTPDLVIIDANDEFLDAVGRSLDEVVGQYVFRQFPKMPSDPAKPKWTALEAALISGEREVLRLTRFDFEDPGSPGVFEERYWSSVVTPVYADGGELKLLELSGREVTSLITQFRAMFG